MGAELPVGTPIPEPETVLQSPIHRIRRRKQIRLWGIRLGCTLWGQYVDMVSNYMNSGRNDIIIILQFCRPRLYDGSVSVSTSFHATKILLDGNSEEVREFRSRLSRDGDDGSNIDSVQLTPPTSNLREQLQQGKVELTRVAELLTTAEKKTIVKWVLNIREGAVGLDLLQ